MSELKVNKISPATGTAFALGDSGDTFTLPSGATIVNSGTATGFGGGGVLQVKSTEKSDTFTSTSSTPVLITGMSVAITPTASSSKILVIATVGGYQSCGTCFSQLVLKRDSTDISIGDADGSRGRVSAIDFEPSTVPHHPTIIDLDDPATTSEVVYTLHGNGESSNTLYFNRHATDADALVSGARASSSITAIEISTDVL